MWCSTTIQFKNQNWNVFPTKHQKVFDLWTKEDVALPECCGLVCAVKKIMIAGVLVGSISTYSTLCDLKPGGLKFSSREFACSRVVFPSVFHYTLSVTSCLDKLNAKLSVTGIIVALSTRVRVFFLIYTNNVRFKLTPWKYIFRTYNTKKSLMAFSHKG